MGCEAAGGLSLQQPLSAGRGRARRELLDDDHPHARNEHCREDRVSRSDGSVEIRVKDVRTQSADRPYLDDESGEIPLATDRRHQLHRGAGSRCGDVRDDRRLDADDGDPDRRVERLEQERQAQVRSAERRRLCVHDQVHARQVRGTCVPPAPIHVRS